MNIDNLKEGISRTGFILEYKISRILSENGWSVINNKYYIDDLQESVREIDILAYKASLVNEVYIYTVLIISCKKSDKNAWVFLSKRPNHDDPNMEWTPIHAWSNDRVLAYMLDGQEWRKSYISALEENKLYTVSRKPENHIFSFQEMNKESGSPQNDKNIFNSITSVMKAQAYEMNALPLRKKDPCVFQFNLLSVAQTDLVRFDFTEDDIKFNSVTDEIYLASYIIDKKQTDAKIHFINSCDFENILKIYNDLHDSNIQAFNIINSIYYNDFFNDYNKLNLFRKDVAGDIFFALLGKIDISKDLEEFAKTCWLYWDESTKTIEFQIELDSLLIEEMNRDVELRLKLDQFLKKYYKYQGKSIFSENDIPF